MIDDEVPVRKSKTSEFKPLKPLRILAAAVCLIVGLFEPVAALAYDEEVIDDWKNVLIEHPLLPSTLDYGDNTPLKLLQPHISPLSWQERATVLRALAALLAARGFGFK